MDELQTHLDSLSAQSRTARFWIDVIIRPTLLCMKFVRAEREGDFYLTVKIHITNTSRVTITIESVFSICFHR